MEVRIIDNRSGIKYLPVLRTRRPISVFFFFLLLFAFYYSSTSNKKQTRENCEFIFDSLQDSFIPIMIIPIVFFYLPSLSCFFSTSVVDHHTKNKGNGLKGVHPLLFWSNGGVGQTRPREAPARAPDCTKFSSDALARCPQTLPSTHTFSLFFEHVVGANGTAAREGS